MNTVADVILSLQPNQATRIVCPECSHERKKSNIQDVAIHTTSNGWLYHCHHCQAKGFVPFKTNN